MTPIYECDLCHFTFTNNVESHQRFRSKLCAGKLKPVFYASDLIKEIEKRRSHDILTTHATENEIAIYDSLISAIKDTL